jgi:hypothetical protein
MNIATYKSIARQLLQHTHGLTHNNGTTGLCNSLLGNSSVNTLPRWHNDITFQQCLAITWLVFSVWSAAELCFLCCPCCGYITLAAEKSFSWVPRFQGNLTRNNKKTSYWFEVLVSVLRSVARRRLVKMENSSARVTLNCKLCKSVIALY